ncbi:hypothetical protein GIB67_025152 [Kingdonia uniflora]|uniref:F-box domain-containing protein n=1 Tax=Kingdonia uniflora TaxID=39325 RepID=A0A7J7N8S6_9MAGN|nr:hypothetical protein GIB67_025152 [Kingdonia uniflora]
MEIEEDIVEKSDFISNLPESLLFSILSLLDMYNMRRTSMLSKRWRYLWTYIPRMDFHERRGIDFAAFVDKSLSLHVAPKIEKFRFHFDSNHTSDEQIDAWIKFAVERFVVEFDFEDLAWWTEEEADPILYKIPDSLFCCRF